MSYQQTEADDVVTLVELASMFNTTVQDIKVLLNDMDIGQTLSKTLVMRHSITVFYIPRSIESGNIIASLMSVEDASYIKRKCWGVSAFLKEEDAINTADTLRNKKVMYYQNKASALLKRNFKTSMVYDEDPCTGDDI